MNAVDVKNLRKKYDLWLGSGFKRVKQEVLAVRDVSLTVPAGQSVAFIGPNGAGKSTTIKILTGILRPSDGDVKVLGLDPWRDRKRLAYRIGAVFGQRSQLWYHLPPSDTFELLCRIYNLDKREFARRRDELVERFRLADFLKIPVRKLSLGQRMRAELAASLLHRPQLLFLDEPTIGLDVIARQELRDLIRKWNREDGLTLFLTSHDTGDIEDVADRVVVINHGKVVLDDTVANMRRQYLGSKILTVVFHDYAPVIDLPGVQLESSGIYTCKLEVDTSKISIADVISYVINAGAVADISVEDPPLETVITHIFNGADSACIPNEAALRVVSSKGGDQS